jgi:hypothetical protein
MEALMSQRARLVSIAALGLMSLGPLALHAHAQADKPQVKIPDPGVPQIMTMEGRYVRAAYNNEGYAILGYQLANMSIGEKWMLLEFGVTVRDGVEDYDLTRDKLSLETPDGKTIPLPSMEEYRKVNLAAMQNRAKVQRDSINYFPPSVTRACRIGFFADLDQRGLAWDKVQLSNQRGCVGRLYFPIPDGITYGQHWLNVQFAQSVVRVPFRIFTKDEAKLVEKNFKDIKKQVDEAFKKKKS